MKNIIIGALLIWSLLCSAVTQQALYERDSIVKAYNDKEIVVACKYNKKVTEKEYEINCQDYKEIKDITTTKSTLLKIFNWGFGTGR